MCKYKIAFISTNALCNNILFYDNIYFNVTHEASRYFFPIIIQFTSQSIPEIPRIDNFGESVCSVESPVDHVYTRVNIARLPIRLIRTYFINFAGTYRELSRQRRAHYIIK